MATIKNNMTIEESLTLLKRYNQWRRGAKINQPNPAEIGLAIDRVIQYHETVDEHEIEKIRDNNKVLAGMVDRYRDILMKDISRKLDIYKPKIDWTEELEKCKESVAYFYNNYFLINGEKPKKPVTDEDINDFIENCKIHAVKRRRRR